MIQSLSSYCMLSTWNSLGVDASVGLYLLLTSRALGHHLLPPLVPLYDTTNTWLMPTSIICWVCQQYFILWKHHLMS